MAGAKRFEELLVWQRMNELHLEVWTATDRPPASRDFRFRDQIRDASESAMRNVSEGFGRFNPREFAHFLDISCASALETQSLLMKAHSVGYLKDDEFRRLNHLVERGLQALARFQRYLRSPRWKRNAERRYGPANWKKNDPNENVTNDPNDVYNFAFGRPRGFFGGLSRVLSRISAAASAPLVSGFL